MCNKLLQFENEVKIAKIAQITDKIIRIQMKYAFRKTEK